jgi:hypothetical protein
MSRARAYVEKDTWITEASVTSNFGLSPILEVWNKINPSTDRKEWARALVKFSLTSLTGGIVNTGKYPDPRTDSSVSAYMYLFNAPHGDPIASNFTIWAMPLTADWTEGTGLDNDNYSQTGFADALSATNSQSWTSLNSTTGAHAVLGTDTKVYDSSSGSMSFSQGEENLKIDVTTWLKAHLNTTSANNGFLLRMSNAQESKDGSEATAAGVDASVSSQSFFTKKFYGRETNTRKRPYIQLEWPGEVKDDRELLRFSKTGNLYFYNMVDGVMEDLNGTKEFPGHVTLSANGVAVSPSTVTASRFAKGVYKVNIGTSAPAAGGSLTGINIGTSSSTSFVDSWVVTTAGEYLTTTGNLTIGQPVRGAQSFNISNFNVNLLNKQTTYDYGTIAKIRIFVRDKSTILSPVTGSTTAMSGFIVKSGTVEIREKATDTVEVQEFEISYDKDGNWFELNTNNLYPDIEYKVVLKLNIKGDEFHYDRPELWNFFVV